MKKELYSKNNGEEERNKNIQPFNGEPSSVHNYIKKLANYDALTDLPNRTFFMKYLSRTMQQIKRDEVFGVILFDLDGFRYINDALGHSHGDQLIREVAYRLKSHLEGIDMIARMGGDEFILLIQEKKSGNVIECLAEKILRIFDDPFVFEEGIGIYTTASIGISRYPLDGKEAETLIKKADLAMYQAKKLGKNNYCFFESTGENFIKNKLDLINDLAKAIHNEEFELYYQPKIDVKTMSLVGMEALIRWNHPKLGTIHPNQFIPLAEKTGQIVKIDQWVLKNACMQNKQWQKENYTPMAISINISAINLNHAQLVEKVEGVLEETGLAPGYLELEITESTIIHNIDYASRMIRELQKLGVKISMDDFGTGYASISNIKKIHLDTVKIDKDFIMDLHKDTANKAIVATMISMANTLGVNVIAEGVEEKSQLEFLKKVNCDQVQGYLFSKPLSGKLFKERWLVKQS
ncbi:EAL domain-containing protein [Irregularibacter muris]|uniref:EAL domain-containing protein n=1 Tax=Irregularibacter muris TaxID=1796619 RepID=A0AAE3HJB4_9FIRM|nr:EAL domain-containing protein [Irregularibacter muris]MCR1899753.1 EAL domain-containing protein [Irregularibacter muris]